MEHNNKLYLTKNKEILKDNNYRYIISNIEIIHILKKNKYITILDNFNSFCDELLFDKNIFIKIISKILSCKTGINDMNKYFLQGKYTDEQIKNTIYMFIQKYLLCIACDKPEVFIKYKNNKINQKCNACGNITYLDNCKQEIIDILKNCKK